MSRGFDWQKAKRRSDGWAAERDRTALERDRWKKEAATGKQLQYMKALGIKAPAKCTRGMASQLIDDAKNGCAPGSNFVMR